MLVAKITLFPEAPMKGIEEKRQKQPFPNLGYGQCHQRVCFKTSVQRLNLNLRRNYSQETPSKHTQVILTITQGWNF